MEAAAQLNERQRVAKTYQWLVIAVGSFAFLGVAPRLPFERIDLQFLLIAVMTILYIWLGRVNLDGGDR